MKFLKGLLKFIIILALILFVLFIGLVVWHQFDDSPTVVMPHERSALFLQTMYEAPLSGEIMNVNPKTGAHEHKYTLVEENGKFYLLKNNKHSKVNFFTEVSLAKTKVSDQSLHALIVTLVGLYSKRRMLLEYPVPSYQHLCSEAYDYRAYRGRYFYFSQDKDDQWVSETGKLPPLESFRDAMCNDDYASRVYQASIRERGKMLDNLKRK